MLVLSLKLTRMDGQEGGQASGQDHVLSHADTLTENSVANRCVKEESFTAFEISAIFYYLSCFFIFFMFQYKILFLSKFTKQHSHRKF